MIRDQDIPYAGLKEMLLYQNIRRSSITKSATHLNLFPYSEVIGWILPQTDPSSRIISDVKREEFSSFHLTHIAAPYKLPPVQVMITEYWIKGININPLDYTKKLVVPKK